MRIASICLLVRLLKFGCFIVSVCRRRTGWTETLTRFELSTQTQDWTSFSLQGVASILSF